MVTIHSAEPVTFHSMLRDRLRRAFLEDRQSMRYLALLAPLRPTVSLIAEIIIGLAAIQLLTPHILLSDLISSTCDRGIGMALHRSSTHSQFTWADVRFWINMAVLAFLATTYSILRSGHRTEMAAPFYLPDAMLAFSCLTVLDTFSLDRDVLQRDDSYWLLLCLSTFFLSATALSSKSAERLLNAAVMLCGIQALYAICFYALRIFQFETPGFGQRTAGTLGSPNALYPLCILVLPVGGSLGCDKVRSRKVVFITIAVLCGLALILTYSRAGWLAIAIAVFFMLGRSDIRRLASGPTRLAFLVGGLLLLLGAGLIRTHGNMIGSAHDRSTLGRLAIWQAAARSFARHPLLGTGIGTFPADQAAVASTALARFNPLNADAKSLYLNISVEQGILGLLLFFALVWSCSRFFGAFREAREMPAGLKDLERGMSTGCLAVLLAGFVDTPILQRACLPSTFLVVLLIGTMYARYRHAGPLLT